LDFFIHYFAIFLDFGLELPNRYPAQGFFVKSFGKMPGELLLKITLVHVCRVDSNPNRLSKVGG